MFSTFHGEKAAQKELGLIHARRCDGTEGCGDEEEAWKHFLFTCAPEGPLAKKKKKKESRIETLTQWHQIIKTLPFSLNDKSLLFVDFWLRQLAFWHKRQTLWLVWPAAQHINTDFLQYPGKAPRYLHSTENQCTPTDHQHAAMLLVYIKCLRLPRRHHRLIPITERRWWNRLLSRGAPLTRQNVQMRDSVQTQPVAAWGQR